MYGNDNSATKIQTQIGGVPTSACSDYEFTVDAGWISVTTGGTLTSEQCNLSVDTTDQGLKGEHDLNLSISLASNPSLTVSSVFKATVYIDPSDPIPDLQYNVGDASISYTKDYKQLIPEAHCL